MHQLPAILELGKHNDYNESVGVLQKLLDDEKPNIRVAAYTALLDHGNSTLVTRTILPDGLKLDVVKTDKTYAIYAAGVLEPRIVLFGQDMKIKQDLFFETPDGLLRINARRNQQMFAWRKLPRRNPGDRATSTEIVMSRKVSQFVTRLAEEPKLDSDTNKVKGLGLTYSQVISVLYRMCENGDIPATFVMK